MKKILIALVMLMPLAVFAQSVTNSPYSQYGLGEIAEPGTGFNRGMNGLGIAFYEPNQVNYLNPASYANIDSLTFIFDVGAALQITRFTEGGAKKNGRTASFEYAVTSFRIKKNLGGSFGIIPFSNIGYEYTSKTYIDPAKTTYESTTNSGDGNIRNAYLGLGYSPVKGLRIGANIGYIWGEYTRYIAGSFSDAYITTTTRYYTAQLSSWKLDLGFQYTHKIGKKDYATIGVTYTPGHSFSGDADLKTISTNTQTSKNDTAKTSISRALFIPTQIGVGLSYYHGTKLHVGLDYTLQRWSEKPFPALDDNKYQLFDGLLKDRHRITLGGEFVNKANSRRYLNRVHVRAGFSYATPYIKVNGQDGPGEISASLGLGLPITNSYNNRSIINISAQYCRHACTGLVNENIFRINIGITFNERWFMKWKLE